MFWTGRWPNISPGGVVDSAGYRPALSPGSLASAFGQNLAAASTGNNVIPLPTNLGGVNVLVNGVIAPLQYAGQEVVNFQIPGKTPLGPATVQVFNGQLLSAQYPITVTATSPGMFQNTTPGQALVIDPSTYTVVNSLKLGGSYFVYAQGLGTTSCSALPDGGTNPIDKTCVFGAPVQVVINGQSIAADFAGLAPALLTAIYQVNFTVPGTAAAPSPTVSTTPENLELMLNGQSSNIVQVQVQQ